MFNHFNLNSYGYCYGNPVLYVDPNGKQTIPGPIRGIGDGIVRVFNSIFTPSDGEVEETSNDVHKMLSSEDSNFILIRIVQFLCIPIVGS